MPPKPSNRDAEQVVVSSILSSEDARIVATNIIGPGDIFDPRLRNVYSVALSLDLKGAPVDPVTVCDELNTLRQLNGDSEWIESLFRQLSPGDDLEHYIRIVERDSLRRKAISLAEQINTLAWGDTDADSLIAMANQGVQALARNGYGELVPISQTAHAYGEQIRDWADNPLPYGGVRGLSTGLPPLDRLLGGLSPADLLILFARTSMGKSALACEIARRVGITGKKVLIFALEMTRNSILARWAASRSGVSSKLIERGLCPEGENDWYATRAQWRQYNDAIEYYKTIHTIMIDDSPALTSHTIRARSSKAAREKDGIDLIVVDHGGLMKSASMNGLNEASVEGKKAEDMKALGKELGCPVILVWQSNRAPDLRTDHRPALADLRASGKLEESADQVLGLYRDEYYNPTSTDVPNQLEVLGLKQRDGARSVRAMLYYNARFQQFAEVDRQREEILF